MVGGIHGVGTGEELHQIWGTLVGRWYVTVFGATFLWRASRYLGWRRTLLYAVAAVGIGALAENCSVHFGFPTPGTISTRPFATRRSSSGMCR